MNFESRKWKSNDLSLAAMSHQISVTHSLCSRHILVRHGKLIFFVFFQHSLRSRRLFFEGERRNISRPVKKKLRRLLRRLFLSNMSNMTNMARGFKNVCEFVSDIASLGLEKSLAVAKKLKKKRRNLLKELLAT